MKSDYLYSVKFKSQIPRIGLLSPCLGNLGNAAIVTSMITGIRERLPEADIVGITLSVEDTQQRHGIPAFPITGSPRANYAPPPVYSPISSHLPKKRFVRLKRWARRIPLLSGLIDVTRALQREVGHIRAALGIVRTMDRVIITGGGALDEFWGGPWGHPWTLFKWGLLCKVLKVPFWFVSVGKCSLEHRLSRLFAWFALQFAEYRSYRDKDSKIAVQHLIDADDPVYPDLAFGYPCTAFTREIVKTADERLVVGVSPMAYCDPRVWPIRDEQRYRKYLNEMAKLAEWLVKEGHRVVIFATDNPDAQAIADLKSVMSSDIVNCTRVEVLMSPPQQTTDGLLRRLKYVDIVIASRLHGVVLSHLIGIPVLAISYDAKVDAHMRDIRQEDYCVDIEALRFEEVMERFNALKFARERESVCIRAAEQAFRQGVEAQYDKLFGPRCFPDSRHIPDYELIASST